MNPIWQQIVLERDLDRRIFIGSYEILQILLLFEAIYADIHEILDIWSRSPYLHLDFAIYWIFDEIGLQDQIDFALLRPHIMIRGFLLDDLLSHDHVKPRSRPLHKNK